MLRRALLGGAALGALAWHVSASAQRVSPHIATQRGYLKLPESEIDFGKAKLAIDQMADPSLETAWAAKTNAQRIVPSFVVSASLPRQHLVPA